MDTDPALFVAEPAPIATPGLFDDVPDLAVTVPATRKAGRPAIDDARPAVQRGLFDLALVDNGEGRFGLVIDD